MLIKTKFNMEKESEFQEWKDKWNHRVVRAKRHGAGGDVKLSGKVADDFKERARNLYGKGLGANCILWQDEYELPSPLDILRERLLKHIGIESDI